LTIPVHICAFQTAQPWSSIASVGPLIFGAGSDGSTVTGISFTDSATIDIQSSNRVKVWGNVFNAVAGGPAITVDSSSGVSISNNVFTDCVNGGIEVSDFSGGNANGLTVSGNTFTGVSPNGFVFLLTSVTHGMLIQGLSITANMLTWATITIEAPNQDADYFAGSVISGNNWDDTYAAGPAEYLLIQNAHAVTVQDNSFNKFAAIATNGFVPGTTPCSIQIITSAEITFVSNQYMDIACLSISAGSNSNNIDLGSADVTGDFLSCVYDLGFWDTLAPDVIVC